MTMLHSMLQVPLRSLVAEAAISLTTKLLRVLRSQFTQLFHRLISLTFLVPGTFSQLAGRAKDECLQQLAQAYYGWKAQA